MKITSAMHPLRERRFPGSEQDSYRTGFKFESPTLCPECHAVFHTGRWQWLRDWPADAHRQTCPACRRIQDHYPAGWLSLKGAFVREHRAEFIAIARHAQEAENRDHPLHRIMRIADQPGGLMITTTDIHLPRRIGEALRRAHKGEFNIHYDVGGCTVRAEWTRE